MYSSGVGKRKRFSFPEKYEILKENYNHITFTSCAITCANVRGLGEMDPPGLDLEEA